MPAPTNGTARPWKETAIKKSKPPKPSASEIALQQQQTMALGQQMTLLEQQNRRQEEQYQQQQLLAPLLYEQMGLKPQYNDQGQVTGYERFETPEQALYREQIETMRRQQPTQEALQQQYLTLAQQQAEYAQTQQPIQERLQQQYLTIAEQQAAYQKEQADWQRELAPQMRLQAEAQTRLQQQMTEYQAGALKQYEEQQRLQPLLYEASGVRPIYDEAGTLTSFALTEEAQARKDYENQLLEHQRKALAGELPVDPTLERTLAEGETQLRAQLQAQLGTGYETSTPGIQALEEFRRRAAEARSNVAHGQLTSGQQLLATQQEMNQRMRGQATSGRGMLGEFGLQPVSFGQSAQAGGQPNYLGLAQGMGQPNYLSLAQGAGGGLFQAGSPAASSAGYQAAVGSPYGTLGQFGELASRYGQFVQSGGNLVSQMANRRMGQYQASEQGAAEQAGIWGTAGSILGGAVAGVASWGNPAAISAGMTLGGVAGQYAGRATY